MKLKSIFLIISILFILETDAQSQFVNSSFEQWINDSVVGWQTSKNNVAPVNDAKHGSKAIQLIVIEKDGNPYSGYVMQTLNFNGGKPIAIRGWYKMNVINGEKLAVLLSAVNTDSSSVYGENDTSIEASSIYKEFYIPINIQNIGIPPNSLSIVLGIIGDGGLPGIGTDLILDDIQIVTDNQNDLPQTGTSNTPFFIYPNPSSVNTSIGFFLPLACDVEIHIMNSYGLNVSSIFLKDQNTGNNIATIPTQDLSNGTYFIVLKTKTSYVRKTLVIHHE